MVANLTQILNFKANTKNLNYFQKTLYCANNHCYNHILLLGLEQSLQCLAGAVDNVADSRSL